MTLKEFFKRDRFAVLAGCELLEIREGYARARMTVEEHHLNGGDFCQGGAIFTLADLAFAAAVNSHLVLTVSTSSNITYFRSVPLGATVYAEARELVDHHRMPYAEVRITDEQGRLVAIFTSGGYRKSDMKLEGVQPPDSSQ
ncbi:MAG: PaaI family thioesterase [Prevotella sp.]|nr:PaaI family thioesterase [Prevotella sp.]